MSAGWITVIAICAFVGGMFVTGGLSVSSEDKAVKLGTITIRGVAYKLTRLTDAKVE